MDTKRFLINTIIYGIVPYLFMKAGYWFRIDFELPDLNWQIWLGNFLLILITYVLLYYAIKERGKHEIRSM